nr:hypothetical protein [uncultured Desulfobacter sp.]
MELAKETTTVSVNVPKNTPAARPRTKDQGRILVVKHLNPALGIFNFFQTEIIGQSKLETGEDQTCYQNDEVQLF